MMSGRLRGYVNGVVDGEFRGVIEGEMGATVRAKDYVKELAEDESTEQVPELPGNNGKEGEENDK